MVVAVTDAAIGAIRQLTLRYGQSAGSGVRIASDKNRHTLAASVADAPEAGDRVVEGAGAPLYLDQLAVTILDGQTLDAKVDENGSIVFSITGVTSEGESGPSPMRRVSDPR